MRRLKLPSASTALALVALFVALGGTGYAAVAINGKNVKTRTITGKKFKNNTLTGKQVAESKLGTVPKAKAVTTAGTANALTGPVAAGLVSAGKVVNTDLVKLSPVGTTADNSPLRTVLENGPFKIEMSCFSDAPGRSGYRIRLSSSEPGSIVNSAALPLNGDQASSPDSGADDSAASLIAPSGKTLMLDFYVGINTLGASCVFAADGVAG